MNRKVKIEHWSPFVGCAMQMKGGAGCWHCRAASTADWSAAYPGSFTVERNREPAAWDGTLHLLRDVLERPARWKRPRLIWVGEMGEMFAASGPLQTIQESIRREVFDAMALYPQHTFIVQTSFPKAMYDFVAKETVRRSVGRVVGQQWPPENVWFSMSVRTQKEMDEGWPFLRAIPTPNRVLRLEPLLEEVDITKAIAQTWSGQPGDASMVAWPSHDVRWVVVGGETGYQCRPMHRSWLNDVIGDCQDYDVPVYVNTVGEWGQNPGLLLKRFSRVCVLHSNGRRQEVVDKRASVGAYDRVKPTNELDLSGDGELLVLLGRRAAWLSWGGDDLPRELPEPGI